jgi:hypothetical protein
VGACVVLAVAAVVATLTLTGTSRAGSAGHFRCPPRIYTPESRRPDRIVESVLGAARRQIPVAYRRRWVNQSGVVRLTRSTYEVTAAFAVWNGPSAAWRSRYFREAARACGGRVATASWVVLFQVPEAQSAMYSTGAAFLAPVGPRRWRLWYAR